MSGSWCSEAQTPISSWRIGTSWRTRQKSLRCRRVRRACTRGVTCWCVWHVRRLPRSPRFGAAHGAGSEFALSCDMRFGSRESDPGTIRSRCGSGARRRIRCARLCRADGPRKGLEVILCADDFSADLAERYGYINRAVPDEEIEAFVDSSLLGWRRSKNMR